MVRDLEEIKRRLEAYALENGVPIIRRSEREGLLSAASLADPGRILEIGTAIGYSSLLLAEAFPEAEIDTIELDPSRHQMAEEVMKEAGFSERVHCHLGDAGKVLETLFGPYDFVYLDGPKGQYLKELLMIEDKLAEKAVIAADNVLFRGLVRLEGKVPHRYRTLVMRLRDYISYVESSYDTKIYEDGDGLAVSIKKGNV